MKMHKLKNNYCEVVTNGPSLISFKINNNDIVDHLEKTVRQKVKELEMENKKIITKA